VTLLAVPNISEGRDTRLIARIAGTQALLDIHSDPDHNRSVLTYGGERDVVVRGVLEMISEATESLDIRTHSGVHPRFGVVDVLPLVAYDDNIEDAIDAAETIESRVDIPVFTYGDERPLPVLRRYLREHPPVGHPTAGVICLGIREPLIAFNVNTRTSLAQVKAAAIEMRKLSGVRALALELASNFQLSMNLTDLGATGPEIAFRRAAELVDVLDAEVVGLVPAWALPQFEHIPLALPVRSIEEALSG
jgi:glutamate formiminotransferase